MPTQLHPENLIPANTRSPEEHRRISSNGGKKSGEMKRQRKTFREVLEKILDEEISIKQDGKELKLTRLEAMNLSQVQKAIKQGDTKAAMFIRDTIGEKPIDVVELTSDVTPDKAAEFANSILGLVSDDPAPESDKPKD